MFLTISPENCTPNQGYPNEFVSPTWYNVIYEKKSYKQYPAPFMVSSPQITHNRKSDLEISPAEYYPLYRKHRVTLGNSLAFTEIRDPAPLPDYLRQEEKFTGSEFPDMHIRFMDNQVPTKSVSANILRTRKKTGPRKSVANKIERVIMTHYIDDTMSFTDITVFNVSNEGSYLGDEILKKPQNPCRLTEKLKWHTSGRYPRQHLKDMVRVTKMGPDEQPRNFPSYVTTPKIKRTVIKEEKDTGPGPGSYNLSSMFGRKTIELCMSQMKMEQTSLPRYLDTLIANSIRDDTPGPGKYTILNSSFDVIATSSNHYITNPHYSRKKPDDQKVAPNSYDVNYKLVEPFIPTRSMKGSERNTISDVKTISKTSPATYIVKNDNISHKIYTRIGHDQRFGVIKRPFDSSSKRNI